MHSDSMLYADQVGNCFLSYKLYFCAVKQTKVGYSLCHVDVQFLKLFYKTLIIKPLNSQVMLLQSWVMFIHTLNICQLHHSLSTYSNNNWSLPPQCRCLQNCHQYLLSKLWFNLCFRYRTMFIQQCLRNKYDLIYTQQIYIFIEITEICLSGIVCCWSHLYCITILNRQMASVGWLRGRKIETSLQSKRFGYKLVKIEFCI